MFNPFWYEKNVYARKKDKLLFIFSEFESK